MRILICLLLIGVVSCTKPEAAKKPINNPSGNIAEDTARDSAIAEATAVTIQWYDGGVEDAFGEAAATGRPLFLYWGAVWCPPCQEIKHTVFKSQAFINLSRMFVPVYLDGDTDQAQSWGDRFGVKGYPTMIVFNPAGQEVTRIPGGIDISRYNTVLALSLERMTPTSELVALALNDLSSLTGGDYTQLAYYSWAQDTTALPAEINEAELFRTLAINAPAFELSARFYMHYLLALLKTEDAAPEFGQLEQILDSDELILACWDTLAYYSQEILALAADNLSPARFDTLEQRWVTRVYGLRFHEDLSSAEKLAGWLPKVEAQTARDAALGEADIQALRAELRAVNESISDSFERQSVIDQMSYVLRQAGLPGDARHLLLAELDKSASPYYFMSGLASLAEQEGRYGEALAWRRRAFEDSTGAATRFQWGVSYVLTMIRLTPADQQRISETTTALLAAFGDGAQLFVGRNFRGLRRLHEQLLAWERGRAADGEPVARTFSVKLAQLCSLQPAGSLEENNCQTLLAGRAIARAG